MSGSTCGLLFEELLGLAKSFKVSKNVLLELQAAELDFLLEALHGLAINLIISARVLKYSNIRSKVGGRVFNIVKSQLQIFFASPVGPEVAVCDDGRVESDGPSQ